MPCRLVGNLAGSVASENPEDSPHPITPKATDGSPLATPEEAVFDADPTTPGVQELKEWQALVALLRSFPDDDGDGVAEIPEGGARSAPRVIERPSLWPGDLYHNATWVLWGVTATAGALLAGLLLAARAARRRLIRRRATRAVPPLPT